MSDIARILREGYDVGQLNTGLYRFIEDRNIDVMVIDTHPGLAEETLTLMSISDALLVLLRPDSQDYLGTGVVLYAGKKLDVPRLGLLINQVPISFDFDKIKSRVESTYDCPVIGILPHSEEMLRLASSGIFVHRYPEHPITKSLQNIVENFFVSDVDASS